MSALRENTVMENEISDEERRRIRTWLDTPPWKRCPEDLIPDDVDP